MRKGRLPRGGVCGLGRFRSTPSRSAIAARSSDRQLWRSAMATATAEAYPCGGIVSGSPTTSVNRSSTYSSSSRSARSAGVHDSVFTRRAMRRSTLMRWTSCGRGAAATFSEWPLPLWLFPTLARRRRSLELPSARAGSLLKECRWPWAGFRLPLMCMELAARADHPCTVRANVNHAGSLAIASRGDNRIACTREFLLGKGASWWTRSKNDPRDSTHTGKGVRRHGVPVVGPIWHGQPNKVDASARDRSARRGDASVPASVHRTAEVG